nr:hypothetical protein [Brevibacillus laterosporus]
MEWLQLLKSRGFTKGRENPNTVDYSNQLKKEVIEQFVTEFSSSWETEFVLYLDDDHSLSLPTENSLLSDTLDQCYETVDVKIEIKKSRIVSSSLLSAYNIHIFSQADVFIKSLNKLSFAKMDQCIFYEISQPVYIIIYDQPEYSIPVINEFIAIGDINILNETFEEPEKRFKKIQDKIKNRNENIRWNREISMLSPDVYFFDEGVANELTQFFNRKAAKMCVAFTALNTEYSDESQTYFSTYSGLKQTKFQLVIPDECEKDHIERIYSLYNWAYSEKTADKIGLIQNIINIHVKEETNPNLGSLLNNINEIFEMVKENYRVYIQKSVKSYLDERKQVEDFIRSTSSEIGKQISGLTDIVTKNLFGLLGTAITTVIGFNKPENQAYIPWILYVYSFFSISLAIYYSTLANANKKVINEVYKKRINDYKKIFLEDRIDQITGNSIDQQMEIFNRYLHWTVWPSILISLIVFFIGLMFHGFFSWIYTESPHIIEKVIQLLTLQ